MKKFLTTIAFLPLLLATGVMPVLAADAQPPPEDYGLGVARTQAGLPSQVAGANTIPGIVGKVIAAGLSLLGIVFFLLILYAGLIWMKARGNTEEVEKAKNIIEGAIIGLVLVTAAYAITNFVFSSLTATSSQPDSKTINIATCKQDNHGGYCVDQASRCSDGEANKPIGEGCVICCYAP